MISLRHQTARQPQISQPSCSSRLSYPLTHGICEFVGMCGCVCVCVSGSLTRLGGICYSPLFLLVHPMVR